MRKKIASSPRGNVGKNIIVCEIIGFFLVIATDWVTAVFDPPYLFAKQAFFRPIDMYETFFETFVILMLALIVILFTLRLIRQIKYLGGFMVICASCKNVKVDDNWVQIEKIISDKSDLKFSHGICPSCAAKLYGDLLKDQS